MNLIQIADSQGRQQSYDPNEALRLWSEGAIPRDSRYWQEGMTDWRPAVEYFERPPASTVRRAVPSVSSSPASGGFAKDPIRLTRFLVFMLRAHAAMSGLAVLVTVISLATREASQSATDELSLQDILGLLVSLPQLLIILVTGISFLMWIHRANRNARGLGARGMTFTPGWSVGWYFVPIANLWKPYQAMKQIWQASANPMSWPTQKFPPLLSAWWTLWIIGTVLSRISFRMSMRAHTGPELIASDIVTLLSDLVDIPLCFVAIRVVREIMRLQTHWVGQATQAASSCGICRQPMSSSDMILLNDTLVCAQCKPILLQRIREGGITAQPP